MALFAQTQSDRRPPAVAGSFYPGRPADLTRAVEAFVEGARAEARAGVRAIVAPHAGYVYSGAVAGEAFAAAKSLGRTVKRAVVIGPSHFVRFRGIAAPASQAFVTPLGEMPVDGAALARLTELPQVVTDDAPHAPDHALEVELPFLQVLYGALPIVPLIIGAATAEEVAEVLATLWDEGTLIVVSSDLSHYHDYESARRLDQATAVAIEAFDAAALGPTQACGHLALGGLLLEAERRGLHIERLDLRNSGDTAGDRRSVVGYGAWALVEAG
ncbi:MAG: AmmeMemoRadiSam system protein B [Methyloligellaceae bacterium]